MNTYPFDFRSNEVTKLALSLITHEMPLPFCVVMTTLLHYDIMLTESDASTRENATKMTDEQLENMHKQYDTFANARDKVEEFIQQTLPNEHLTVKVIEAAARKAAIFETEQTSRKLAAEVGDVEFPEDVPSGLRFKHKGELKVLILEGEDKDWLYVLETDGKTWVKERKATPEEIRILERKRKR